MRKAMKSTRRIRRFLPRMVRNRPPNPPKPRKCPLSPTRLMRRRICGRSPRRRLRQTAWNTARNVLLSREMIPMQTLHPIAGNRLFSVHPT